MMKLNTLARKALVVAIVGCVGTTLTTGQQETHSRARTAAANKDGRAEISARAMEWLKESDVPSLAVAYIENRKVAWTEVYGEQSPGVPATAETLYNVASLTKPVTAETVLRLASAGKLSLDESMAPYWLDPDIKDDPRSKSLTPRLCLSHQTGFPNWRGKTGGVLKIQWDPGTQTGYSGEGYNYVGRFAEKKLGKSFDLLAQEMVFDPIGMKGTSYTAKDWQAGRLAVPHGGQRDKPVNDVAKTWNGADLLRTTISDYARFVVSVMHDERLTKEIAAERATLTRDRMKPEDLKNVCSTSGEPGHCLVTAGMGLGWEVETVNGEKILDHDGSDWGVKTFVMFVPSRGIGLVLLTNGENGEALIKRVVEVLYPNKLYVATM
jgi:CubicO group peptidase (beta-lactamase class C family)